MHSGCEKSSQDVVEGDSTCLIPGGYYKTNTRGSLEPFGTTCKFCEYACKTLFPGYGWKQVLQALLAKCKSR